MDSARRIPTMEIVDADQLEHKDAIVNKLGFICRGCDVVVTPCSYQAHNKKRAYFSAKQGHQSHCDIFGEIALLNRARKERVATEGFAQIFPSRLILKEHQVVTSNKAINNLTRSTKNNSNEHQQDEYLIKRKNHARTALTIGPMCRTFINFPFNRDLPLIVPDIESKRYNNVFWRLKSDKIIEYFERKIFYAPISWKKIIKKDECLEVDLSAGEWEDNQLIRSYRVYIDWKSWSQSNRDVVIKNLNTGIIEARKAKDEGKKHIKGWLFFIGVQDSNDRTLFRVNDYRLIYCHVDEMIYPPK